MPCAHRSPQRRAGRSPARACERVAARARRPARQACGSGKACAASPSRAVRNTRVTKRRISQPRPGILESKRHRHVMREPLPSGSNTTSPWWFLKGGPPLHHLVGHAPRADRIREPPRTPSHRPRQRRARLRCRWGQGLPFDIQPARWRSPPKRSSPRDRCRPSIRPRRERRSVARDFDPLHRRTTLLDIAPRAARESGSAQRMTFPPDVPARDDDSRGLLALHLPEPRRSFRSTAWFTAVGEAWPWPPGSRRPRWGTGRAPGRPATAAWSDPMNITGREVSFGPVGPVPA